MDTLYWSNLNPTVKLHSIRRQYYEQYLWKLVMAVPGAKLLKSHEPDLSDGLLLRALKERKRINWGGSWRHPESLSSVQLDLDLLKSLRVLYCNSADLKFRITEPNVQVYAETQQALQQFTQALDRKHHGVIREVHGITDGHHQIDLLKNHAIITTMAQHWQYKLMLREGVMSGKSAQAILRYLSQLSTDVKVSGSTMHCISVCAHQERGYIWGGFMYTNQPGIDVMLNLIDPGVVRKIHPLVSV